MNLCVNSDSLILANVCLWNFQGGDHKEKSDIDEATMEAVRYLVADCNYGGRITDVYDRRLLSTLLKRLVSCESASTPGYDLSELEGKHQVPKDLGRANVIEIAKRMPVVPDPRGLGLAPNSAIVRDARDSKKLLRVSQ